MLRFDERVAIVTGASGALGGVVARRLLEAGARVALIDRGNQGIASLLA